MGMIPIEQSPVGGIYYYQVASALTPHQWEHYIGGVQTNMIQLMTPLPIVFVQGCKEPPALRIWETPQGAVDCLEFATAEGTWKVFNHPFALAPWGFV